MTVAGIKNKLLDSIKQIPTRVKSNPELVLLFIVVLCTFAQTIYFYRLTELIWRWYRWFLPIAEALIVTLPYILLGRKWKWVYFIWSLLWTILLIANHLYFVRFGDTLNLQTIIDFDNYNGFVFDSGMSMMDKYPLRLFLFWAIPFISWICLYKSIVKGPALGKKFKWIWSACVLCCFFLSEYIRIAASEKEGVFRLPTAEDVDFHFRVNDEIWPTWSSMFQHVSLSDI